MLNPSDNRPAQRLNLDVLIQLSNKRPIAFWGGLWASIILVAAIAATGLISTGPPELEKAEPKPTPTPVFTQGSSPEPTAIASSQDAASEGLPMWLYGAIATSCATGTVLILIALRLKPSRRRRQPLKRSTTAPAAVRKKRPPSPKRRPVSSRPMQNPPVATFSPQPVVTILPPEETHPLDWGDDSLADMMDIRKRQSLSSLIDK